MSKTTTAEAIAFRAAYLAGEHIATGYKPGDLFLGAWGEADAIGYPAGSIERVCFTTGYLAKLPQLVITDRAGRLLQIGGSRHG